MTVTGRLRPFDLDRDLDDLAALLEISFAGELSRRGGDFGQEIRSIRRVVPIVKILSRFSESFRHLLDGFVWEDQGRLVASALVQREGNDRTYWEISTVATHPDYRRQGLARTLVSHAMEYIRAHGGEVCTLEVRADNVPAYDLYRSLGFAHYDSVTQLKLEGLPEVQAQPANGYTLRPMSGSEWQARYELAQREIPVEVQAFLPVRQDQYRQSTLQRLLMPLLSRLQRRDVYRWAAEQEDQLLGFVRLNARRSENTIHMLRLKIDPAHCTSLGEPLLTVALEMLQGYPRENILTEIRTSDQVLQNLFKQYGFVVIETGYLLGVRLNALAGEAAS